MATFSRVAMPPQAGGQFVALVGKVRDLCDEGTPPPCVRYPEHFTGDRKADGEAAAELCLTACPVLDACHNYAEAAGEGWHVWGGRQRTG